MKKNADGTFGLYHGDRLIKTRTVEDCTPEGKNVWIDFSETSPNGGTAAFTEYMDFSKKKGWIFPYGSRDLTAAIDTFPLTFK